jgi:hypothetical protein
VEEESREEEGGIILETLFRVGLKKKKRGGKREHSRPKLRFYNFKGML